MMLHRHMEELARQQEAKKAAQRKAEEQSPGEDTAEAKEPKRTRKSK